jgi:hypothetical protein
MRLLCPPDRRGCSGLGTVTWASGPSDKTYVTHWKGRDYDTTMRLVSAVQVDGAVAQPRFLVIRTARHLERSLRLQYCLHWHLRPMRDECPTFVPDARMEHMLERGFVRSVARDACSRRNWYVVLEVPKEWELWEAGLADSVLKQTTVPSTGKHLFELLVLPALAF